ncbi:MAG: hypothetical protein DWQ02_21730 [Bacteroidetes bacterium]|nr:MAG: hypothetical protein DWQ02_21730 [Bacteroidota bacterium]
MSVTKRYSDEELELFKIHIEQKKVKELENLSFLLGQIDDVKEAAADEADWQEDTSGSDLEMLYTMVNRHRKHLQDLENALIRIRQKSYGVCILSGELIDKRRLMAVPTTTKSLAAKNEAMLLQEKKEIRKTSSIKKSEPKTTTKVIRKTKPWVKPINFQDEEDELFMDDLLDGVDYNELETDMESNFDW